MDASNGSVRAWVPEASPAVLLLAAGLDRSGFTKGQREERRWTPVQSDNPITGCKLTSNYLNTRALRRKQGGLLNGEEESAYANCRIGTASERAEEP